MIYDTNIYHVNSKHKDKIYWRCQYRGCNGRCHSIGLVGPIKNVKYCVHQSKKKLHLNINN